MAVFRVEKSKDYTVMSNHHLRNSELSLRAKGLLSQILSLPDDWDYTIAGLAAINKEGKDAVRAAVQELEKAGYIERRQTMGADGKFSSNEYVVHEYPVSASPLSGFPTTEKPSTGKPSTEEPLTENPTELNKDKSSKEESKKKSKKEKAPKETPEPLTDEQLRDAVVAAIMRIADSSWTKEVKNELFALVMTMYDPNRTVKKAHPVRSQNSVDAMFRKLTKYGGTNPDVMICMLCSAIEAGWQGVQPPNGNYAAAVDQKPPSEGSDVVCL